MKIQTPGTGGLARSISCHETGLPEKPPLQATRKDGKWRVVHFTQKSLHFIEHEFGDQFIFIAVIFVKRAPCHSQTFSEQSEMESVVAMMNEQRASFGV